MALAGSQELQNGSDYSFTFERAGSTATSRGEFEARIQNLATIANPSFAYAGGTVLSAFYPNRVSVSFRYVGGPGNTVDSFGSGLKDQLTRGDEILSFIGANGGRAEASPVLTPTITKYLYIGAAVIVAGALLFGAARGFGAGLAQRV